MKYLLTSSGLTTRDIMQECIDLVGKKPEDISIGLINEAHAVESGDKRWILNEWNRFVDVFGGEIDLINLLALSPDEVAKRIEDKDVIYVLGGHSEYLMYLFNKTGFSDLLRRMEKKVYVGSSAGSMVVSTRMSTKAYEVIYGEQSDYGVEKFLGFTDFTFFPHLNSPDFKARTPKMLQECEHFFGADTYCLEDTQAISVDGETVKYIGGKPLLIREGQIVRL